MTQRELEQELYKLLEETRGHSGCKMVRPEPLLRYIGRIVRGLFK